MESAESQRLVKLCKLKDSTQLSAFSSQMPAFRVRFSDFPIWAFELITCQPERTMSVCPGCLADFVTGLWGATPACLPANHLPVSSIDFPFWPRTRQNLLAPRDTHRGPRQAPSLSFLGGTELANCITNLQELELEIAAATWQWKRARQQSGIKSQRKSRARSSSSFYFLHASLRENGGKIGQGKRTYSLRWAPAQKWQKAK